MGNNRDLRASTHRFTVHATVRGPLGLECLHAHDSLSGDDVVLARLPQRLVLVASILSDTKASGGGTAPDCGTDEALGSAYAILSGPPKQTLFHRVRELTSPVELEAVASDIDDSFSRMDGSEPPIGLHGVVSREAPTPGAFFFAAPWTLEETSVSTARLTWAIRYSRTLEALAEARRPGVALDGGSCREAMARVLVWAAAVLAVEPVKRTEALLEAMWAHPSLQVGSRVQEFLLASGVPFMHAQALTEWRRDFTAGMFGATLSSFGDALRGNYRHYDPDVCANPKGSWHDEGLNSAFSSSTSYDSYESHGFGDSSDADEYLPQPEAAVEESMVTGLMNVLGLRRSDKDSGHD